MEELAPSYQVRPTVSVLPGVELIKLSHVVNARMAASIWPWSHVWVLGESKNPWSPESRKVQEKVEPILAVCTADEEGMFPRQQAAQIIPIQNDLFIDGKIIKTSYR